MASGAVPGALLLGFVGEGNYTARIEFECSFALTKLKTAPEFARRRYGWREVHEK
jgi:hypothetical protein